MTKNKGEFNLLAVGAIAILAVLIIVVMIMLFYNENSGLNNATLGDYESSRIVNAENSGKGNTQIKGITAGGDANINTGSQSGN